MSSDHDFGVLDELANHTFPLLNSWVTCRGRSFACTEDEALTVLEYDANFVIDIWGWALPLSCKLILRATIMETHCSDLVASEINITLGLCGLIKVVIGQHTIRVELHMTLIHE